MNKVELRQLYLTKRKALAPEEVERRSQLITLHFIDFLEDSRLTDTPLAIHTFLPIRRQNEVDTWPIIRYIWTNCAHINVAVSVTDISTRLLRHYHLFPQTLLVENRWGIPEPVIADQLPQQPASFDIVLVPLLVFDLQGQRIGYGGGFYDRFLAECRPDCLKIGLSLFEPVERIDDVEPTDVSLSLSVTPTQAYNLK